MLIKRDKKKNSREMVGRVVSSGIEVVGVWCVWNLSCSTNVCVGPRELQGLYPSDRYRAHLAWGPAGFQKAVLRVPNAPASLHLN